MFFYFDFFRAHAVDKKPTNPAGDFSHLGWCWRSEKSHEFVLPGGKVDWIG